MVCIYASGEEGIYGFAFGNWLHKETVDILCRDSDTGVGMPPTGLLGHNKKKEIFSFIIISVKISTSLHLQKYLTY